MEKSEHVLLLGAGAEEFAKSLDLAFEDNAYFYDDFRYQQWQKAIKEGKIQLDHSDEKKFGTVGAVAIDNNNNLAAATSTGGMTNKRYNRVGDSAIIGAGTYANNNTCAISCTGHGEPFIRAVAAYDVSCLMEYKGLSLQQAMHEVVMNKLPKMDGEGGMIGVDAAGNVAMVLNSAGMYRGMRNSDGENYVKIYHD